MIRSLPLVLVLLALGTSTAVAIAMDETDPSSDGAEKPGKLEAAVRALKFRSIGPALMSGRIADIAIDPVKPNTWYVAAGSGNLWKTVNAGTTWTPIFENESTFTIGAVAVAPSDPDIVWVGGIAGTERIARFPTPDP